MIDEYKFSNLNENESIINEIKSLEREISKQVGYDVILIAYNDNLK